MLPFSIIMYSVQRDASFSKEKKSRNTDLFCEKKVISFSFYFFTFSPCKGYNCQEYAACVDVSTIEVIKAKSHFLVLIRLLIKTLSYSTTWKKFGNV
jgi:hypothetical protein